MISMAEVQAEMHRSILWHIGQDRVLAVSVLHATQGLI